MIRKGFVGFLAAFFIFGALPAGAEEVLAVARVIDGDSLLLTDGTEVRLIGVDAPEFKDQKRNRQNAKRHKLKEASVNAFAAEAKHYVEGVVFSGDGPRPLRLELDPANAENHHRDKYGRFLAYIWIDSTQLNARLIEEGRGFAIRYFPYKYRQEFDKLEDQARKNKKGIWSHV